MRPAAIAIVLLFAGCTSVEYERPRATADVASTGNDTSDAVEVPGAGAERLVNGGNAHVGVS